MLKAQVLRQFVNFEMKHNIPGNTACMATRIGILEGPNGAFDFDEVNRVWLDLGDLNEFS